MFSFELFVIDDDHTLREGIDLVLGKLYRLSYFATAEDALAALDARPPDLILLDIGLPGMSGIEALNKFKQILPHTPVIMMTGHTDIDTVIAAMKQGAYDYIVKPIKKDPLKLALHNALDSIRMHKEVQLLQKKYLEENIPFFVGESDAIQTIMSFVAKVAKSPDASVLILGETGTGKEIIASSIHYRSPNFRKPFVCLNCSALPDNLLESELFGYEKGAFSGADPAGKKGLIESAKGGTLFLDEVGDLSAGAQAKLLRFLETGEFYKLGGVGKYTIQTRVVAATNKAIEDLIEQGRFRRDLYYRLAAVKIEVPNLAERREDILPMAKYFLVKLSEKMEKSFSGFSPEAERALEEHIWKGNIRELQNLIERAVLIADGPLIHVRDLGLSVHGHSSSVSTPQEAPFPADSAALPPEGVDLPALHERLDVLYIRKSLENAGGNAARAADLLHMSYYAFRRRREKLGL
jgi:DNA-binding NtrC family response regulator